MRENLPLKRFAYPYKKKKVQNRVSASVRDWTRVEIAQVDSHPKIAMHHRRLCLFACTVSRLAQTTIIMTMIDSLNANRTCSRESVRPTRYFTRRLTRRRVPAPKPTGRDACTVTACASPAKRFVAYLRNRDVPFDSPRRRYTLVRDSPAFRA